MARNEKGSRPTQRNVLQLKEQLILIDIVKEHYAASALNNVAFAARVTAEHGTKFRGPISAQHVSHILDTLGMPNNAARVIEADCTHLAGRVADLEERFVRLAKTVTDLLARLGEKA